MKKTFICSAVWGEEYLEYFENLCLKSLLKNNIIKSKNTHFYIYCEKNELQKIKKLGNIKKLENLITVNYLFLDKRKENKYSYLANYQKKLILMAKNLGYEYFIFCYPDTIFCNGYLKFCKKKLNKYGLIPSAAPLVNFENLPENLSNFSKNNLSKLGNKCLSNFYKNRIDDFYNRSNINLWKNEYYSYYKSFNLHILGVNLKKIIKLPHTKFVSFDENFFTFDVIKYDHIYYVKNSQENIILTTESITSDRNNDKTDIPNFSNKIGLNLESLICTRIKKEKNFLNIFSFIYGDYYVVEKKNLELITGLRHIKKLKNFFKFFIFYFVKV